MSVDERHVTTLTDPFSYEGIQLPDGYTETPRENRTGIAIRTRRRELNLSQAAIAKQMGVTRGLVTQWESGRSRLMLKDLDRLAGVLKTTSNYLLGNTEGVLDHIATTGKATWEDVRMLHQRGYLTSLFDSLTGDERDELIRAALAILRSRDEAEEAAEAAERAAVR